jgi:hypothetical protein
MRRTSIELAYDKGVIHAVWGSRPAAIRAADRGHPLEGPPLGPGMTVTLPPEVRRLTKDSHFPGGWGFPRMVSIDLLTKSIARLNIF